MDQVNLIYGDCLEKMQDIPDGSIDFILTDPPYGTTACSWDTIIPLEPMWEQVKRVIKDNGAIALFGSQPFTSILITSNLKMFKYEWIWDKEIGNNFILANKQPLKSHENIMIFYEKQCLYNPIMTKGDMPHSIGKAKINKSAIMDKVINRVHNESDMKYPKSVFRNKKHSVNSNYHPTQKPVKLMEYLILTYTNKDDTVLDFTMGSGSTGVACIETNRNFIGIELDENYFKIAKERIKKAQMSPRLFV